MRLDGSMISKAMHHARRVVLLPVMLAAALVACSASEPQPAAQGSAQTAKPVPQVASARIAILPFTPGDDVAVYRADGIARHLIAALSRPPTLTAIAPDSSFRLRRSDEPATVIGKRLGATHLLRGKLVERDDRVILELDLMQASDGKSIWHGQAERPATEVAGLAETAAEAIEQAMGMTFGSRPTPDRPPGGSAVAFDALLQGEAAVERGDAVSIQKAIDAFTQATSVDPQWARPRALLALVRLRMAALQPALADALREKARIDADAALRLDSDDPVAHRAQATWLGEVALDAVSAEDEVHRGLALRPDDPALLGMLAVRQTGFAKLDEAAATLRHALELDPLSAPMLYQLGYVNLGLADYPQAEDALRRARDLEPSMPLVHAFLAVALFQQNRTQDAIDEARQEPIPLWRNYALAMAYWANGQRDLSEAELQALIREHAGDAPTQIAGVYAQRDNRDALFHWLGVAQRSGDPGIVEIRYMPFVARYADDPRFKAILRDLDIAGSGSAQAR